MALDTLPVTTDQLIRDRVDALVSERLEQLVTERVAAQVAAAMKKDPARNMVHSTPTTDNSSHQRECSDAACDVSVILPAWLRDIPVTHLVYAADVS